MERLPGDGWREALREFQEQRDDLYTGRKPREGNDGITVVDVCDRFLTTKDNQRNSGEITTRTFNEHKQITVMLVEKFGKIRLAEDLDAQDFEELRADMAQRWGPIRLGNAVQHVRSTPMKRT